MWAALPKYPAKGIMRLAMVAGLCLFALSGLSSQSVAQCFLPAGVEGEITYNSAYKVPQYCDNTNWIAMVGAEPVVSDEAYVVNAVTFDGTNDYVEIDGSTLTPSTQLTFSFWVNMNDLSTFYRVFNDNGDHTQIFINDDDTVAVFVRDATTTQIFGCQTAGTALDDTTDWHHWMFSMDSATSDFHFYVDGTDVTPGWCSFNSSNAYAPLANLRFGGDNYGNFTSADVADVWFDVGTYIDFSNATNRELFYNAGEAVYLGADGSLPTGSAPDIFLSGSTDTWHVNKGAAGGMTEVGALTTAGTAPDTSSVLTPENITQIVSNGLVGHWRFDEVTGTTAADSMGSYDLSYSGPGPCTNALNTREGVLDQSLFLDSNQCSLAATFPAGQLDAMPSFSVGGWIKIRSVNGIYDHFFAKSHSVSPFVSWAIEADIGGAGTISFSVGDSGGSAPDARWDGPYEYDRWYHIFGVKDGGTLLIYVDGELEDTTAFGGTIVQENNSVSLTNGWNERADFTADDYRFYNRALSIDEVQDIYNAREGIRYNESARTPEFFDGNRMLAMVSDPPDVTSGLTGHWKLDETSGTSIVDSSGNGHTGVFNNANTEDYVRGAVMNALRFDGVNNEVQVSDHADLELTTNFTASVWFKLDADNTAQQKILFKEHSVEPFISWEISINASRDVMFLLSNTASNSGTPTSYFYVGSNPISVGQWYHAVAVKNGGDLTFYINGAEDEWYNNGPYTGTIIASDSDFLIGAGGGTSAVFQGEIDDARIYQRALSSAEVQKLYNMGTPAGSSTALPQGCPAVGDVCDDGTVYAGTSPDGGVAMFAAPEDAPSDYAWNDDTAATATTTATDFDTGADNTNTIVIVDADGGTGGFQQHEAAQYCYDLVSNGADDWYLPADNELLLLHNGGNQIADVSTGWQYWSSTEMSNSTARTRDMGNGNPANRSKSTNIKTRCVRKGPAPRCASPYGLEGAMLYNDDNNVVQYCDGARWLAIGKDQ